MKTKKITLALTSLQLDALWSLIDAANHDGDHYRWLKSAGSSPAELRAIGQVTALVRQSRDAIAKAEAK